MKIPGLSPFFVGLLFVGCMPCVARAQTSSSPQKAGQTANQNAPLKLVKSPIVPYPLEALSKNIEGTVSVGITVDASGRVLDVKALSGPPELFQAAIDSAKQWQFEPPAHAPAVTKAEISYGFDKECPAATSDTGGVSSNGRLLDKHGKIAATMDYDQDDLPPYFSEDRKAGIEGDMVLSLKLDEGGKVKEIHVLKSLSPNLDEAAMETVRGWKINLAKESADDARHDFLQITFNYRGECSP
ncbi:MAG: energy transducer TonB [Candidatus Acidiferrales bacterium]